MAESPAEEPRRRLARLMEERRAQLGMFWRDVAEEAGLTTEGLRRMRDGSKPIRPTTKAGIERALRWEHGSIDAILSGGEPAELLHRTGEATISGKAELTAEGRRGPAPLDDLDEMLQDPEARAALQTFLKRVAERYTERPEAPRRQGYRETADSDDTKGDEAAG